MTRPHSAFAVGVVALLYAETKEDSPGSSATNCVLSSTLKEHLIMA